MVAEVYDALIEAGTSEQKAKAAAGAIPIAGELATKEDLRELRDELGERIEKVERELGERIGKVERELGERIGKVEREMGERFGKLERDMAVLKFAYGPVILALLVKIAFFP
ncbi:MAG: hypothetical protein F4X39_03480 [Acidobacteriia bacterium]|nr:hypothetical protein [Terriglobia bacterium]